MKLLCCGDLHLTDKTPSNRVDDYAETVLRKLRFVFETARNEGCEAILQPGDLFDGPTPSYYFFSEIVFLFNEFDDIAFICCFGQHDMRYRQKENTAIHALTGSCPHFHLITNKYDDVTRGGIHFYAAGFGEEVPSIMDKKDFNILITHRMIVKEKIWFGQTEYEYAGAFLKNNKFDLIVSGDNHQYLIANDKHKRWLFNCGSMMRSTIAQVDHKPSMIVFDTENIDDWYNVDFPIEENVFDLEMIDKQKEVNEKLDAFVSGLSEHKEMGMSFADNLSAYMKENKISDDIRQIIKEGLL